MDFLTGENFKYLGAGAIIAAIIISVANVILQMMRNNADQTLAKKRLDFDKNLAEQKFKYERKLAKQKLELEIERNLREKKISLAEEVLSLAYDLKDSIAWIRSYQTPYEKVTRERTVGESLAEAYHKDLYYFTIDRYDSRKEQINTLLSRKSRMMGSFSIDVGEAFDIFNRQIYRVTSSARMLANLKHSERNDEELLKYHQVIWSDFIIDEAVDTVSSEINRAIHILESVCRPILSEPPAA